MRSPQFQILSNEHNEGMLFTGRIRSSIGVIPVNQLRNYILWYWSHHIRPHFSLEEKILLPCLTPDHPLTLKLKDDHVSIRELILLIDRDTDTHNISMFCDLVEKHITFEEEKVYTYLENTLPDEKLNEIASKLNAAPLDKTEWKDVFWQRNQKV